MKLFDLQPCSTAVLQLGRRRESCHCLCSAKRKMPPRAPSGQLLHDRAARSNCVDAAARLAELSSSLVGLERQIAITIAASSSSHPRNIARTPPPPSPHYQPAILPPVDLCHSLPQATDGAGAGAMSTKVRDPAWGVRPRAPLPPMVHGRIHCCGASCNWAHLAQLRASARGSDA